MSEWIGREKTTQASAVVDQFVSAVASGNVRGLHASLVQFEGFISCGVWKQAFQKVRIVHPIDERIKQAFVQIWVHYGDRFRMEIEDDNILIDTLRMLLPAYVGPSVRLYRGEQSSNHRHRTYGLSWSSKREIGEHFAKFYDCRMSDGGSVLLEVDAGYEAIICSLDTCCGTDSGESEFLVDRRYLQRVRVVEKFCQLSSKQLDRLFENEVGD